MFLRVDTCNYCYKRLAYKDNLENHYMKYKFASYKQFMAISDVQISNTYSKLWKTQQTKGNKDISKVTGKNSRQGAYSNLSEANHHFC